MAITKNRKLSQVSKFLLAEHSLTLVVDTMGRLVLTTPEVQRSMVQYHVLGIPEGADVAEIRQSLLRFSPVDRNGRSSLLIVSPPGEFAARHLVARICAPSVAQLSDEAVVPLFQSSSDSIKVANEEL